MVLNAYETATDTESVERVSPYCSLSVTQSPTAMNDSSFTRGERKYRNASERLALARKVELSAIEQNANIVILSPQKVAVERAGEMSPKAENEGSSTSAAKKKGLQKLASGAIANMGMVFKGGANTGDMEGRSETSRSSSRNAAKGSAVLNDLTPHSDPGMQEKLSPSGSHKEKFFNKTWRNRLKVVSNAGNALWIPQVHREYNPAVARVIVVALTVHRRVTSLIRSVKIH